MQFPRKRFGYYHASVKQYLEKLPFARENRSCMTKAEQLLWQHIRYRQLNGHKFRRQHIIDRYIVDFVCLEQQLVVEVDGPYHLSPEQQQYDREREEKLRALGFRVIRFTNEDVFERVDQVVAAIRAGLDPTPGPSPTGEGNT